MNPKRRSSGGSNAQQLVAELQATKGVKIQCPCCYEARPASSYLMFTAGDMPGEAKEVIENQVEALDRRRAGLGKQTGRLENAALHAQQVNFGNFAERLIPTAADFPGNSFDYRHLGNPIDYISFHGLDDTGLVQSIDFIDVKTGSAKLQANQALIANAVAAGRVSLRTIEAAGAKSSQPSKGSR